MSMRMSVSMSVNDVVCSPNRNPRLNPNLHLRSISTSFVNDGVCDCCDGSDEPPSVQCPDKCLDLKVHHPKSKSKPNLTRIPIPGA